MMDLIFLKNKVVGGTCPITVPFRKVLFLKAGTVPGYKKVGVVAFFTSESFCVLAMFYSQEDAAAALGRLEAQIAYLVAQLKLTRLSSSKQKAG